MEKEKILVEEFIADAEKYCKYFKEQKEDRGINIAIIDLCEGNIKTGKDFPYKLIEQQEETNRHKYDGEYPPILYIFQRKSDKKFFGLDTYCMEVQSKWLYEVTKITTTISEWK